MSVPPALRLLVRARDRGRCAYCHSTENNSGQAMHMDHIVPESAGGLSVAENLCQVCFSCNSHKAAKQYSFDPQTLTEVAIFHPLRQRWSEHFSWDASGTLILGKTACGRATVEALQMNNETVVKARRRWVIGGWHPPTD